MTATVPDPYAPPEQVPIQEAIRRCMADIGAVGRGGEMTHGERYRYRKLDDLLKAAQAAMIRHGVVVYPIASTATYEDKINRQKNAMQWVSLKVMWGVVGPMGDVLPGNMATVGEANDSSDKATNKAHSAAQKVAIAQLFTIPYASDDQDGVRHELGRGGEPEPTLEDLWNQATDEQRATADQCQQRLDALPADVGDRVLAKAGEKSGGEVVAVADLPPSWLEWWSGIIKAAWDKVDAEADAPQEAHQ